MFFPITAAIVTLVGAFGLAISAFVNASAADHIFNAAVICLVGGPLIFFSYVIIGLCVEFASATPKPEVRVIAHWPASDVPLTPDSQIVSDEWIPERLRREIVKTQ